MKRLLILLALLPFAAYAGSGVLKEDTATQVAIGPFLDGTDGVTAETALTVTEFDCDLIKHADSSMTNTALTITASAGSNDAAHVTSGMYSLELTATDTNTAGRLILICDHATPATFMPVRHEWMVMPTQEYDSLYGTDVLQVHAVEIAAGLITATSIATDAITADKVAADAIGAAEAGFLTDSTGFQGADVAAILADTLVIGTATDFGSGTSTIAANLQDLADNGTAAYDRSTDSLQAIRDRGDSAWTTGAGGSCTADVGCIADGTAQAATSTTIQLASAETFADDELIGATVLINSATAGTGQARLITDYVSSTDTATVDTWTTTPTGTITYRVFGTPPGSSTSPAPANVTQWLGTAAATPTTAGVPEVDVTFVSGTAQTANDIGADANTLVTGVNVTTVEGGDATDAIAAPLVTYRLDELLAGDSDIDGAAPPTVGSVFHELMTKTTGSFTYDQTTDAVEAIRDQGDAAWTSGSATCTDDVICTTVATAPTTTSITATAAPNNDTQLEGWAVLFTDNGDADSYCLRSITGVSTGEISYSSACPFTVAASDEVVFMPAFLADGVDVTSWNGTALATTNPLPNAAAGANGGLPTVNASNYVAGVQGTLNTFDALDTAQDTQHGTTQSAIAIVDNFVDDLETRIVGTIASGTHNPQSGDAYSRLGTPAGASVSADIAALPTAAENAAEHLSQQRVITGTCDSGSTTTCVDDALTQADETQIDDRLICFDDSWCALITGFTPGTDTVSMTKTAPSTRASKGYTIFPATAQ